MSEQQEPITGLATIWPRSIKGSCLTCDASAMEGKDRVCRFDPPKVFAFVMPTMPPAGPRLAGIPQGGGMQVITQTAFPVVRDDQWCKKFTPPIRDS